MATPSEQQGPRRAGAPPVRILLVDDHEDSLMLTKLMLEQRGHHVETAASAASALPLAARACFDLLITGLMKPLNVHRLHDAIARLFDGGSP